VAKKKTIETGGSKPLGHNPFAALAATPRDVPIAPPVSAPTGAPASPPPAQVDALSAKIVVRREKKGRGGKTVTRITGIPASRADALLACLKKALGCGAVREGDDLVLLGSLVDRAADWLEADGARRVVRAD
jgi:translation initiation factor 1